MNSENRVKWSSQLEYYFSSIGYAVGLGSLWRFPYVIYSYGGGAFLIPYLLISIFVGIPLFYLESALGQIFQGGAPKCFEIVHKKYEGIGISQVLISFCQSTYYNMLLAYGIIFFYDSFTSPLPWIEIDANNQEKYNKNYFYEDVLQITESISELGGFNKRVLIANVVAFFIVYLCIIKGIKSTGKIAYISAPISYILLAMLLLRGLFLDGAWEGLSYLFRVDWSKLLIPEIWYRAATQVLFQLGVGGGVLHLFSSYREVNQPILKPTYLISWINIGTGFLCAITVFTYIGYDTIDKRTNSDRYLAHASGVSVEELPLAGPDLVFISYPAALSMMPYSNFWSIIFFFTFISLAIDTQFSMVETFIGYLEDEKHKFGIKMPFELVRFLGIILLFICGIFLNTNGGFYFLNLYDTYTTVVPLMLSGLFECIVFLWKFDFKSLEQKVLRHCQEHIPEYITLCLKYLNIGILFILTLLSFVDLSLDIKQYPWWGMILAIILMMIPITPIIYYYKKYINFEENAHIHIPLIDLSSNTDAVM